MLTCLLISFDVIPCLSLPFISFPSFPETQKAFQTNSCFGFAWLPLCRDRRVNNNPATSIINNIRTEVMNLLSHSISLYTLSFQYCSCYTILCCTVLNYTILSVNFLAAGSRRRTRVNNNRNRSHIKSINSHRTGRRGGRVINIDQDPGAKGS